MANAKSTVSSLQLCAALQFVVREKNVAHVFKRKFSQAQRLFVCYNISSQHKYLYEHGKHDRRNCSVQLCVLNAVMQNAIDMK